jgi:hypothetical protein
MLKVRIFGADFNAKDGEGTQTIHFATLLTLHAPKALSPFQNLRNLRPAICMAQEMGKGME